MSTILFPSPIYGPVHSRRLGISLGINLIPADGKLCSFDCIYCECGYNADHRTHTPFPTTEAVSRALEAKLKEMHDEGVHPDVMTLPAMANRPVILTFPRSSMKPSVCATPTVLRPRSLS